MLNTYQTGIAQFWYPNICCQWLTECRRCFAANRSFCSHSVYGNTLESKSVLELLITGGKLSCSLHTLHCEKFNHPELAFYCSIVQTPIMDRNVHARVHIWYMGSNKFTIDKFWWTPSIPCHMLASFDSVSLWFMIAIFVTISMACAPSDALWQGSEKNRFFEKAQPDSFWGLLGFGFYLFFVVFYSNEQW